MKKIHFIWMGGVLPQSKEHPYRARVIQWAHYNRDWEVNLWVLEAFLDGVVGVQHEQMKLQVANLRIRGIQGEQGMLVRQNLIQAFASEVRHAGADKRLNNWGAASDILRVAILNEEGGLYLDTDVVPGRALGTLVAPSGFLLHRVPGAIAITNDAMYAATAAQPFFVKFGTSLQANYRELFMNPERMHLRRTHMPTKNTDTVQTSGPGLMERTAFEHFKTDKYDPSVMDLIANHGQDIFLPADCFKDLGKDYASDATWLGSNIRDPGGWLYPRAQNVSAKNQQGKASWITRKMNAIPQLCNFQSRNFLKKQDKEWAKQAEQKR
jgi:hypothetical protein